MKLGVQADNPFERVALMFGVVPKGLLEAWLGPIIGRVWIVAIRLGLVEALKDGALDADAVAARCETAPRGTKALLDALAGMGAVERRDGRYSLTSATRKWFSSDSDRCVADFVDFLGVQWLWLEQMEEYVRTDRPLDVHESMSTSQWDAYQRGMRAAANFLADEVSKRLPVPSGAKRMLDVGGSHGYYSVALCRRHAALQAVVFDLPEAVEAAAPILAREDMGERVRHRAGNALTDDFGTAEYDVVFVSELIHHFDEADNRILVEKCAKSLAPGGVLVLKDTVRGNDADAPKQMPLLGALGVAMISESTMWTVEQMSGWLRDVGLTVKRPIWMRAAPGSAMMVGERPR
jgi:2-polyprenyl-3-methyl-5-hydroxy-6-metoxy-1,4-benzoquinol methylase